MDKLAPTRRSQNMAAIRSKNMKPELLVRRLVHRLGYRFRLHRRDLPGKPDIVLGPARKVIFVHGCFWHLHPDTRCLDARRPKSNVAYWGPKLTSNAAAYGWPADLSDEQILERLFALNQARAAAQ